MRSTFGVIAALALGLAGPATASIPTWPTKPRLAPVTLTPLGGSVMTGLRGQRTRRAVRVYVFYCPRSFHCAAVTRFRFDSCWPKSSHRSECIVSYTDVGDFTDNGLVTPAALTQSVAIKRVRSQLFCSYLPLVDWGWSAC